MECNILSPWYKSTFFSNLVLSNNLTFLRNKNQMKNRKHYIVGTIPRHRGTFQWMCYILIMRSSIIPMLCLFPRSRIAERGKLYHTYSMFMLYIVCIRKRETASYLQYCYVLDFVYQIRVITKLPNSEQSYKGKVKTHNYINRQNQLTTGKLCKP